MGAQRPSFALKIDRLVCVDRREIPVSSPSRFADATNSQSQLIVSFLTRAWTIMRVLINGRVRVVRSYRVSFVTGTQVLFSIYPLRACCVGIVFVSNAAKKII